MRPIDYGRSFAMTTPPGDEVRFWVESRTRIIDEQTGEHEDFLQAGSCKSERSFVERDIFLEDNYDFLPILGEEYVVVFRRKAWLNPDYRTVKKATGFFGNMRRHVPELPSCEEITSHEAIFRATRDFRPLVAQTEIRNEALMLRAIIEHPVKTMNTVRAEHFPALAALVDNPLTIDGGGWLYQTDTGPVAFPDLLERQARHADRLRLAYVAFNAPDFAEFIIEEPTPVRDEEGKTQPTCMTRHHTQRLRLPAENRLYASMT